MTASPPLRQLKDFKITPFFGLRSCEKESLYIESIEQRRGWLDSIIFGLQFLVVSFSSYHIYRDDITGENQWIVSRILSRSILGLGLSLSFYSIRFPKHSTNLTIYTKAAGA